MTDAMKESFVEHFDINDINKLPPRRKHDYMVWVGAWQTCRRAALEEVTQEVRAIDEACTGASMRVNVLRAIRALY